MKSDFPDFRVTRALVSIPCPISYRIYCMLLCKKVQSLECCRFVVLYSLMQSPLQSRSLPYPKSGVPVLRKRRDILPRDKKQPFSHPHGKKSLRSNPATHRTNQGKAFETSREGFCGFLPEYRDAHRPRSLFDTAEQGKRWTGTAPTRGVWGDPPPFPCLFGFIPRSLNATLEAHPTSHTLIISSCSRKGSN